MPAKITTKRLTKGPRKGQVVAIYASNGNEVRHSQGATRNRHKILRRARPSIVRLGRRTVTGQERKVRQMKSRRVKRIKFKGLPKRRKGRRR